MYISTLVHQTKVYIKITASTHYGGSSLSLDIYMGSHILHLYRHLHQTFIWEANSSSTGRKWLNLGSFDKSWQDLDSFVSF